MKYIEESWKWLPKYEVDRLLLCAKYWLMSLHTSQNPDLYTRYTPSIHHLGYSSFTLLYRIMHFLCLILLTTATALQSPLDISMSRTRTKAGNPVINGWYADPEARIFTSSQNQTQNRNQYWIYPTTSTTYDKQTTFSAFSSPDLVTWTPHPHILNITQIPWSTNRAAWAPSVTCRNGEYYMYFSVGDGAGIGVARSETGEPQGPFRDVLGKALVPGVVMGAQGIDAQVFIDYEGSEDGEVVGGEDGRGGGKGRNWLYFGGWGHAVVVELGEDMVSLKGEYKEITPEGYVEGPWVLKRKGVYYFLFSVGG